MRYNNRRKKKQDNRPKRCYFSSHDIKEIDYKDIETLQKFISNYQKILPASRMGSSKRYQAQLARAVKRARHMALLPYMNNQK